MWEANPSQPLMKSVYGLSQVEMTPDNAQELPYNTNNNGGKVCNKKTT